MTGRHCATGSSRARATSGSGKSRGDAVEPCPHHVEDAARRPVRTPGAVRHRPSDLPDEQRVTAGEIEGDPGVMIGITDSWISSRMMTRPPLYTAASTASLR